ncbi:MAG: hypothetical protein ACYTAN_18660, partial [Planctomycetota bacterium]
MLERISRALLVGAVTLCLCAGALCAEGGGVLDLVGDEAVGVIAVNSVTDFQQSAGAFADAVQPGLSVEIGGGIREAYTLGTDVDAGLNLDSGAAVVIMLGKEEAGEESAASEASDVEPFIVLVMPLADEGAWREALGTRIAKDEASGFESIDEG